MVSIKTPRELDLMREAGKIVGKVFSGLEPLCVPGVSTLELAKKADEIIRSNGATPTFLNYNGFPGVICISVNEVLIHGIPSSQIILHDGDVVSLDVGATYEGYCADACRTYLVGTCKEEAKTLVRVTKESFFKGIELIKPGTHLVDVCGAIEDHIVKHGYTYPLEFTGHGIGRHLHEDPSIPNYRSNIDLVLREGMCLAIEPMVLMGSNRIRVAKDNWTIRSKDGKISAHYENTCIVTSNGVELTTLTEDEKKELKVN